MSSIENRLSVPPSKSVESPGGTADHSRQEGGGVAERTVEGGSSSSTDERDSVHISAEARRRLDAEDAEEPREGSDGERPGAE